MLDRFDTWCVYCGDYNECQDHVIPVSYNSGNRKLDKGETVNCCNECNKLAGDYVAFHVIHKATYLRTKYERFIRTALVQAKLDNLDLVINGYSPNPLRFAANYHEIASISDPVIRPVKSFDSRNRYKPRPVAPEIKREQRPRPPKRARATRKPLPSNVCFTCKKQFSPYRKWQRFCCLDCRDNYNGPHIPLLTLTEAPPRQTTEPDPGVGSSVQSTNPEPQTQNGN